MIQNGILLGLVIALLKAIDSIMNKSIMENTSPIHHSIYRIIFVSPFLLLAALMNWQIQLDKVWHFVLLYGIIEAVNILFHQKAIKAGNLVFIELLSRSKTIFALILSFVLVIDTPSPLAVIGILLFTVATYFTVTKKVESKTGEKTSHLSLLYEMISVLARVVKPFLIKGILTSELVSTETITFLSMPISLVCLLAVYRPKLNFKEINCKKYSLQALIVAAGMLVGVYAVKHANIVTVSAVENFSVFYVILYTVIIQKKKYPFWVFIGLALAIGGLVLASV